MVAGGGDKSRSDACDQFKMSLTSSHVYQPTLYEWGIPRIGQIGWGASPSSWPQPLCGHPKP
jgi:hypothetical protein